MLIAAGFPDGFRRERAGLLVNAEPGRPHVRRQTEPYPNASATAVHKGTKDRPERDRAGWDGSQSVDKSGKSPRAPGRLVPVAGDDITWIRAEDDYARLYRVQLEDNATLSVSRTHTARLKHLIL